MNLKNQHLNQTLINNIGAFPKLEELHITCDSITKNLDFTPLKKNKSLTTLYINGDNEKNDHFKEFGKKYFKRIQ